MGESLDIKSSSKTGAALEELLAQQKKMNGWMQQINDRIYEMEEKYLLETFQGNIVKGWEGDVKGGASNRPGGRGLAVDDKDRLFTASSYTGSMHAMKTRSKTEKETAPKHHN